MAYSKWVPLKIPDQHLWRKWWPVWGYVGAQLAQSSFCTFSLLPYLMVLKIISPGCGVWASLMLFLRHCKYRQIGVWITFHVLEVWHHVTEFFFLYFQLKPVSRTAVPDAAVSFASSVATDLVLHLLVPQYSSSSLGSSGNKDGVGGVGWPEHTCIHQEVYQGESGHWQDFEHPEGEPRTDKKTSCLLPVPTWRNPGAFGWRQMWRTLTHLCGGPSRISHTGWSHSTLLSLLSSDRVLLQRRSCSPSCTMFRQVPTVPRVSFPVLMCLRSGSSRQRPPRTCLRTLWQTWAMFQWTFQWVPLLCVLPQLPY